MDDSIFMNDYVLTGMVSIITISLVVLIYVAVLASIRGE